MLGLVGVSFYSALSGMIYVGPARSSIFGKQWAEKNEGALALQKEHAKMNEVAGGEPKKFSTSGYPDMGSGKYAETCVHARPHRAVAAAR